MALTRIINWLGNCLTLIASMLAFTAIGALFFSETDESVLFAIMTVFVGLIGLIFTISTRDIKSRESNSSALAFLLLFWLVMPLVMALPYLVLGQVTHPYTGWFEAVSAITTTGASTLDPDAMPRSMHIWRSFLQWTGGVVTATFAVVILAALNLRGTGVHRSFLFTFQKGELFTRLVGIGRVIAALYGFISAGCFVALIMTGTPVFEAVCLALTSVSTGGLTPRGDVLAAYVNPIGAIALALTCMLGAFNVAILADVLRTRHWRSLLTVIKDVEHRALVVIALIVVPAGIIITGPEHLFTLFVEATFFVSSAGFDYHVIGLEMLPPAILIAIALIGGSALSTAGGVKLIRLLLLFRHLETDLGRLTHPSRRLPVSFRQQVIPDHAFLSIWMYFFGYTLVFAIGIISLSVSGMDFEMAVASSAALISNMGPLLDYTMPQFSYPDFTLNQQLVSIVLMLVGRVEVLAAFAILSPGLWRN